MAIPIKYNARNLVNRKVSTGMTVLVICLVVTVFLFVLALWQGVTRTLAVNASQRNILTMRVGSQAEMQSVITREQAEQILHKHRVEKLPLVDAGRRIRGCQRHGAVRRAVVRAIPRDDLVPPRHEARELDGVLVRFGAAVREEGHLEVTRRDFGQQACERGARLGGHGRADRAELLRLLLDRRDDLRVLVPDGDIDEL